MKSNESFGQRARADVRQGARIGSDNISVAGASHQGDVCGASLARESLSGPEGMQATTRKRGKPGPRRDEARSVSNPAGKAHGSTGAQTCGGARAASDVQCL